MESASISKLGSLATKIPLIDTTIKITIGSGYAIPGIVLDFVVWLTPIPLIWKLNLSRRRRIVLTLIFVIGLA